MAYLCHEVEYKLIRDDMQDCIAFKAKMGGVSDRHHHRHATLAVYPAGSLLAVQIASMGVRSTLSVLVPSMRIRRVGASR
jgi:hypothetical protein